jgi:hypothetical protein
LRVSPACPKIGLAAMLSCLIEEKDTYHHEAHEGREGFIHFIFPNFVLFVIFVVKYLFLLLLRLSRG